MRYQLSSQCLHPEVFWGDLAEPPWWTTECTDAIPLEV